MRFVGATATSDCAPWKRDDGGCRLRVIAGRFKGRRLAAPKGEYTRPTSDRVREALFSSLAAHLPGARVLDLYAGSGALGIEALSRGAIAAVFVERSAAALRTLRSNLDSLGLHGQVVVPSDVAVFTDRLARDAPEALETMDVVFADPPYAEPLGAVVSALRALRDRHILDGNTRIIIERDRRAEDHLPDWLELERRRTYGDTVLLFLRVAQTMEGP